MHYQKTVLLIFFSVLCLCATARNNDSIQQDSLPKKARAVRHEIGVNSTMLIKQVFNLSNNTLPTLPYDVTYKLIWKRAALRFGIGITVDNTKLSRHISGNSTIPGPNDNVPTYNNSFSTSIRAGWEKRFPFEKRFVAFAGIDLASGIGNISSQTTFVFNNLPGFYNFQRTTSIAKSFKIGGGPVAGLQFRMTKRLSLLTEIPVYAFYTSAKTTTTNYSNNLQSGFYVETTDTETETLTGMNLSITLPVTLYLVVNF